MAAPSTTRPVRELIPRPPGGWQVDALCAQVDPDLWHPEAHAPGNEARRVCARCPVAAECLQDALADSYTTDEFGGVRAATGPRERAEMRRRILSRAASCPGPTWAR